MTSESMQCSEQRTPESFPRPQSSIPATTTSPVPEFNSAPGAVLRLAEKSIFHNAAQQAGSCGQGASTSQPNGLRVPYDTNTNLTITEREYRAFQVAYDFLNLELFNGTLPQVFVTLQRHANAKGYFSPNRFQGRSEKVKAHELALNPDIFTDRSDEEILSTLAHEMVHVWQQTYGKPPRSSYHDRQWAAKMKETGLYPTSTGEPGGKETGQSLSHYIIPGGKYEIAYAKLAASGFRLTWQSVSRTDGRKKAASKTRYSCPYCGTNAWAKPQTALICGACYMGIKSRVIVMRPQEWDEEQQQEAA